MSSMKGGLRSSRFLFNLTKKFSTDFVKMLAQVEKYTNAEEAMAARKEAAPNRLEGREKQRRDAPIDERWLTRPKGPLRTPPQKFHEYMPLSVPQS